MLVQPTSPNTVLNTPITHQRVTRNNKPTIISQDDDTNLIVPPLRRSTRIKTSNPNYISQDTINNLVQLSQNRATQFTPKNVLRDQTPFSLNSHATPSYILQLAKPSPTIKTDQ